MCFKETLVIEASSEANFNLPILEQERIEVERMLRGEDAFTQIPLDIQETLEECEESLKITSNESYDTSNAPVSLIEALDVINAEIEMNAILRQDY